MPQTFYIESDEEIISVIGRLRKTDSNEILFVFPKRALVLQSIINLRLLAREAEKCGKEIVIVSQDEVGRMLAEKAGIPTENYSEEIIQKASHLELSADDVEVPIENNNRAENQCETDSVTKTSVTLGTDDFFGSQKIIDSFEKQKSTVIAKKPISLRIRNASPEKFPSLNSKRVDFEKQERMKERAPLSSDAQVSPVSASLRKPLPDAPVTTSSLLMESTTNERLKNFYASKNTSVVQSSPSQISRPVKAEKEVTVPLSKSAQVIFFLLGLISVLSLGGVFVFFFLPKAEITVTPYLSTQKVEKEFSGTVGDISDKSSSIATRIIENTKEVSVTVSATGKGEGSGQKARGTVQIMNNYSAESQLLIATTRLETSDGKLFRLEEGVVVPGMKTVDGKNEPGMIEAKVIADQAGEEYNSKDSASFSIPGFKGSEKYTKFTAKSVQSISGGGTTALSDVRVIAKVDIDTAVSNAKEKAKEAFLADIRNDMLQNEAILGEQVEVTLSGEPSLPVIGSVASTFEYKASFTIKALLFDEQKMKEIIINDNAKMKSDIPFHTVSVLLSYADSAVDFSARTYAIKAHAMLDTESSIDNDALRAELKGKKESEIKSVLEKFPEVKNFKLNFSMNFVHSIPNNLKSISIIVLPGERDK